MHELQLREQQLLEQRSEDVDERGSRTPSPEGDVEETVLPAVVPTTPVFPTDQSSPKLPPKSPRGHVKAHLPNAQYTSVSFHQNPKAHQVRNYSIHSTLFPTPVL